MNFDASSPATYPGDLDLDLSWAVSVLKRRRRQITGFVVIALAGAALALMLTPKSWQAASVLLLETQPPGLFRPNSVFSETNINEQLVDTQVEVLRSSQLLLRVVDDMKLAQNADFNADTGIPIPGPMAVMRRAAEWLSGQLPWSAEAAPAAAVAADPRADALDQLQENLEVARVGGSNTILISYTATQPALAASIANRVAELYIASQLAWQPESIETALAQVEDRVIITRAAPPPSPSGPRKSLVLAGALLAGLFTGLATAFAREWLDETVQTPEQLERLTAARCISQLPRMSIRRRSAPQNDPDARRFSSAGLPFADEVLLAPESAYSEAVRQVAVRVRGAKRSFGSRVIGVTAITPGGGGTSLASAMALVMANTQAPCLLIDGDLRQHGLTRLITPEAAVGLRDVVNGSFPLQAALWSDVQSPLRFLPAVHSATPGHPADVLGSPGMSQLLKLAAKSFRTIIIDLPPLKSAVDAHSLAPELDAVVLVAAKGTSARDINHVLRAVPGIAAQLTGTVLNRV